jgi:hypothetical protein
MTLYEYEKLTDTDRAFLKLEGRCDGCGCKLNDEIYIVHADWCKDVPQFIWPKPKINININQVKIDTTQSRQVSKSVFNNILKEFNKMFRNKNENTNSR